MTATIGTIALVGAIAALWWLASSMVDSWTLGLVVAWTVLASWWLIATEALSALGSLNRVGVVVAYLLLLTAATYGLLRLGRQKAVTFDRALVRSPWFIFVMIQGGLLLVLALAAAPNNFDSMAYHLPRVEMWAQEGSIAPFATHFDPQVYMSPLAEFGLLHIRLLWDVPQLLNLVQWAAHVVTLVGVAVLAAHLGLGRRGRAASVVTCATIPLLVGEAATTQNDYVVVSLVVSAAAMGTRRSTGGRAWWLVAAALAGGLAVAAKPTSIAVLLPLGVWLLARHRAVGGRRLALAIVAGCVLASLANVGWLSRNADVYASVSGPESKLTNTEHGPRVLVGNVVRNVGTNLAVPLHGPNEIMQQFLRGGLSALKVDPDDPAAVYTPPFAIDSERNEDRAASPFHTLLLAAALVWVAVVSGARRQFGALALVVVGAFLVFSFLFKWQPWGGRLMLPFLALGSVLIGAMLADARRSAMIIVLAVLVAAQTPWLVAQKWRPLVGPDSVLLTTSDSEWFRGMPQLQAPYADLAETIGRLSAPTVALGEGTYAWEYPLIRAIHARSPNTRIIRVDVEGETSSLEEARRSAWIVSACSSRQERPDLIFGPLCVYAPR